MLEPQLNVTEIDRYRKEIDAIDNDIILLLAKRFETARKIAALKRMIHQPVVQPERQQEVERKYVTRGRQYAFSEDFMVDLYHLIHEETCRLEERIVQDESCTAVDKQV